ncbi:hypothetical protein [Streptomyces sp. NPDC058657]
MSTFLGKIIELNERLGSVVRYIRTARSRNSSEFLGAAMVDGPLMSPA